MEAAINELAIRLATLRNNEPIKRQEGRTTEADADAQAISEIVQAIEVLRQKQLSSLPALELQQLETVLKTGTSDDYLSLLKGIEKRRDLGL